MKHILMKRLDEIALSLSRYEDAVALITLGSVGMDIDRLDQYSDIDFFVIVKDDVSKYFINNLDWLREASPLAYYFYNTTEGCKILFEDGVYGEYAVFSESRLKEIPLIDARLHWVKPGYDFDFKPELNPVKKYPSIDYALNEATTNIYVGLNRYLRGEKLSAYTFIQGHALNNVLSVLPLIEPEMVKGDFYTATRRLEKRFPQFAEIIQKILVGYDKTPEAAMVLMAYITTYSDINQRMVKEIEKLYEQAVLK